MKFSVEKLNCFSRMIYFSIIEVCADCDRSSFPQVGGRTRLTDVPNDRDKKKNKFDKKTEEIFREKLIKKRFSR